MAKNLFVKSYGCQMNVYDSARMADTLTPLGYRLTDTPGEADLIILNTCHIREKAAEKVYSELGRLKRLKRDPLIAVAGCVAQAEGEEILRRAPHVDMVFGPQTYHRLPQLVVQAEAARTAGTGGVVDTEFPAAPKFDFLPEAALPPAPSAYVTIQEGCDRFCAFCVVPYTRGAEYSRPAGKVIDEARALVAAGAKEITLLGQNVNAYHGEGLEQAGLAGLIRALGDIPVLARLRYTTSHPNDLDDALIRAHRDVPRLMPHLHLPVQSGSDRVLGLMNRGHKAADYLRLAEALRQARPDIALSSDFIVGHPGETDADFEATLRLVHEAEFAQAYSFKFSPRPGTPAADMAEQVPETVKAKRLAALQELLAAQQLAFNRAWCGRQVPVLFDRRGRHGAQLVGRSPHMQAVHVDCADGAEADALFGTITEVEIGAAHANSLTGRIAVPACAMDAAPSVPRDVREPAEA